MQEKLSTRALACKLILCGFFVAILISFVRAHDLAVVFARINWYYLACSLLLSPLMLLVSCLKWKVLLDLSGKQLGLPALLRIYLVGYFFSNLLPSTVGGDVVRSYYSGRLLANQAFAAVCVFVERFTGLLLLLVLVIVAPAARPGLYANPYFFVPAALALVLICLLLLLWRVREPLRGPARVLATFLHRVHGKAGRSRFSLVQKIAMLAERFSGGFQRRLTRVHGELGGAVRLIRENYRISLAIGALTVLFYALTWVNIYVSFLAFGVNPGFAVVVALVPTIMFVAQVPLTFLGNLGFYESVFVVYFLQAGVLPAETLAMGLLLRAKILLLGLAGLFVYLVYKRDEFIRARELPPEI